MNNNNKKKGPLSDDNTIPLRNVKLLSVNAVLTIMHLTCYTRVKVSGETGCQQDSSILAY